MKYLLQNLTIIHTMISILVEHNLLRPVNRPANVWLSPTGRLKSSRTMLKTCKFHFIGAPLLSFSGSHCFDVCF